MTKADTLLKKAVFFEKMALYSDRKSFLTALAQSAPNNFNAIEPLFLEAFRLIGEAGGDNSALQSAWQFKQNPSALAAAIDQATSKITSVQNADAVSKLRAISNQIKNLSGNKPTTMTLPETVIEGTPPAMTLPETVITGFPPIPKDVQKMLSDISVSEGFGSPLNIDGEIGRETRRALNGFKTKFNIPSNYSNKDVFEIIKNTYNRLYK